MTHDLISLLGNIMQQECGHCGRTGIHCPACGAKSRYAKVSEATVRPMSLPNNSTVDVRVMVYACRSCGLQYDDGDWLTKCEVPQFESKSMKERRAQEAKEQEMAEILANPESRMALLRSLFPSGDGRSINIQTSKTVEPQLVATNPERIDKGPDIFELERKQHGEPPK